ncbi:hypothetical protein AYL99_07409 [Fonsecaea erecta]|uniref:Uncharacterized protein n=1 Tax=Fonsecaea erecta TaxID=1367422 RepID=A0A178ZEV6_9EURO|nr:hypothetical protein AYL99_07409 [Fonsecaea erecta]OAP58319.1 hypothetical protein AYL99_07409 [Fonsecaea erecta]
MSSSGTRNDASNSPPLTHKKESKLKVEEMATSTAKTANSANAPDPEATPKSPTSDGAGFTTSTTPSAQHGAITAWGSTSGKLFLSDPRLNDGDSTGTLWEYILKLGSKNVAENRIAEKAEAAKTAQEEDDGDDENKDKESEID